MEGIYQEFKALLEEEKKEEALLFALGLLERKEVDVLTLYQSILAPALNHMECKLDDRYACIWKEHIRTAIIRTIVECCYPYVLQLRKEMGPGNGKRAIVLCPPEEYHDLGARMVSDYFTILGYESVFVGANTPYQDFYHAIDTIRPDVIAISVSNFYNLVSTKRIIKELRTAKYHDFTIIVGGAVFDRNKQQYLEIGADDMADTYEDLARILARKG